MQNVTRVTQSPMNALRWVLDLACGHEVYATSKRRPTRKKAACEKCKTATVAPASTWTSFARAKYTDPDFRKDPKTDRFCARCQKDIAPGKPYRLVHLLDGGFYVLHPADEALFQGGAEVRNEDGVAVDNDTRIGGHGDLGEAIIGPDCARLLGLEWSRAP